MRHSSFLYVLAAALLAAAGIGWTLAPRLEVAPAAPVQPPLPAKPRDTDKRIFLDPVQQKEATVAGGFAVPPKSLLRVRGPLHYGDWKWDSTGISDGPVSVRIDLRTQLLSVFRGEHEIGTAVVLYGADKKETPVGRFPILWKGKNHRSSLYDAQMPFTLRLTGDGVAIHGSNVRWGAATHGCVGVPTDFARELFAVARVGDPVLIVRSAEPAPAPATRIASR